MSSENVLTDMFLLMAKQYWWIFLILIFAPLLKILRPIIKGKIGEGVVNLMAKLRLDSDVYHLIKDVTIPSKKSTTQIDHIIVSKFGVFVIETKNYTGWIFADTKSPKWMQVNFKQKHQFQNPLRQNYGHICALSELLNIPKEKLHGIVCFMGDAKFKTKIPEGVFLEGRYVTHIKSFKTPLFSDAEVTDLVQQIETGRFERSFKTNRAHVKQLKSRRSAGAGDAAPCPKNNFAVHHFAKTLCPKCGADMVLRTARRGSNTGNQFWGCSNFPSCREILPV